MSRLKNLILNYSNLRIVKRGVFTIVLTLIITLPLLVTGCGRFDSNDNGTPLDSSTEENRTTASRVAVATAGAKTLLLTVPTRGEILQSQSVPANAHGVTAVDDKIFVGDRRGTGLYSLFVSEEEREQKKPSFISLGGPAHHLASSEEFVFVTVTMKNYVAVVNAKTEKLKAKISVPKPYYAIVVPQRNRLYVTSKSTDSIRGIDLDTHKVTETIAVGKAPSHLMFDGERLWVTNAGSGDVSVVNPSTGQELKRIPTGADPHGIAFDSKTKLVIVSNRGEGTLSIVDAGRLEHINNQDAGGVPDHLISVDDRILVALRDPGVINVLNPATMNVERTLQIDMEPHQMVVVPETDRS